MVAYSFKRQFGTPIRVGLGQIEHIQQRPEYRPKRQTIRSGFIGVDDVAWGHPGPKGKHHRHARQGERVQLYTGMRTKTCVKLGEGICTGTTRVTIWFDHTIREVGPIHLGHGPTGDARMLEGKKLLDFVRDDGFDNPRAMYEFWMQEHANRDTPLNKWSGVLITWRPPTEADYGSGAPAKPAGRYRVARQGMVTVVDRTSRHGGNPQTTRRGRTTG